MRYTTIFGALAVASLAFPALAQDGAEPTTPLQRALASVNEGDEEFDRPSEAKPGFFGRGFTITAGETEVGVGGQRFGLRDDNQRDKTRVDAFRVINR
ncbi:MAG: hypothetical protein AAF899_20415 [Pseudomonadota bacterium]